MPPEPTAVTYCTTNEVLPVFFTPPEVALTSTMTLAPLAVPASCVFIATPAEDVLTFADFDPALNFHTKVTAAALIGLPAESNTVTVTITFAEALGFALETLTRTLPTLTTTTFATLAFPFFGAAVVVGGAAGVACVVAGGALGVLGTEDVVVVGLLEDVVCVELQPAAMASAAASTPTNAI